MESCNEFEMIIKKTKDYFTEYNNLVWNSNSRQKFIASNNDMEFCENYYLSNYFLQEYLMSSYRASSFNVEEYTENNEKVSRITLPNIVIPEFKVGMCNLGETLNSNTINNIANEIKSKLNFRFYSDDEDDVDYYYDFDSTENDDWRIKIGNPLKNISIKKAQEGINKGLDQVKKGVGQITNPILDPIKDAIKSTGKAAENLPSITIEKPKVSVQDIKDMVSLEKYNSLLAQFQALKDSNSYLNSINENIKGELKNTNDLFKKAQKELESVKSDLEVQKKLLNKINENINKAVVNTLSKVPVPCLAARRSVVTLGIEARYPIDYSSVVNKILNIAQKAAMAEISMVIASSMPAIIASGGTTLPGVVGVASARGLKAFRESITNSLQLINETGINGDIIKIKEINESNSDKWITVTDPSSLSSIL